MLNKDYPIHHDKIKEIYQIYKNRETGNRNNFIFIVMDKYHLTSSEACILWQGFDMVWDMEEIIRKD